MIFIIPAQAGIQGRFLNRAACLVCQWIPACAGMTKRKLCHALCSLPSQRPRDDFAHVVAQAGFGGYALDGGLGGGLVGGG